MGVFLVLVLTFFLQILQFGLPDNAWEFDLTQFDIAMNIGLRPSPALDGMGHHIFQVGRVNTRWLLTPKYIALQSKLLDLNWGKLNNNIVVEIVM